MIVQNELVVEEVAGLISGEVGEGLDVREGQVDFAVDAARDYVGRLVCLFGIVRDADFFVRPSRL